jgi:DNA-binding HxlR family transcriptional regulator/DNA-binding Lrp family transcriptional regulator
LEIVRSAKADQLRKIAAERPGDQQRLFSGRSYLERLGVLYMDEIRLTIVMELYMRPMSPRQFFKTIGGTSDASVRRHFARLVENGWLRKVRTETTGPGRPEVLYRSTEQAVIDTETWGAIPVSIRDSFTVMLLEEMGFQLGEALEGGTAEARADRIASFKTMEIDELAWCRAHDAIERCFQTLARKQTDAKIRLETSGEQPILMIVNLGAFEAAGPQLPAGVVLPKVRLSAPPARWPYRIGKVFSDRLDLAIVEELNRAAMTPAQVHARLGGMSHSDTLRRCNRLVDLGWAAIVKTRTGGPLRGAKVHEYRAASPTVSEREIIEKIPAALHQGRNWDAFEPFLATSVGALDAGAFNHRSDRHLTMSPLMVDEAGWTQVIKVLRSFEKTLLQLEVDLARRRPVEGGRFPAAFLLSSFQAPLREMRQ